jgi:hypothetical protein
MTLEQLTSLTSKERILLYLSDFVHMDERYELPRGLTQESIAFETGIQRKHLSQYLKDLLDDDLVVERKAHVESMKQRMNGYYLTPGGYSQAVALRRRVSEAIVPVEMDGKTVEMKVEDIDDSTSVHITLSDIVREAICEGSLRMSALESVEERKRAALEEEEQSSDVYKRALMTAWHDGRVTATERFLVEELRKHLKISDEEHKRLESEIVKRLAQDHMEFRRIYRSVLEVALADREISGPEERILENLRRIMRLSRREHEELVREVEILFCGPPACDREERVEIARMGKAHM